MDGTNITDITIGIKFEKAFRIRDLFGEFTDKIVYLKDSNNPFKNDFFAHQFQNNNEMVLESEENNKGLKSYLKVDPDNVVFRYVLKDKEDMDKGLLFIEKGLHYLNNLLYTFSISNFIRLGIVYNHKMDNRNHDFDFICKKITGNKVLEFNDLSCRFSKRIKEDSALIDNKNKDFNNLIYNFWVSGTETEMGIDYQYYFIPSKQILEKKDITKFLKNSKQFLNEYFYESDFIKNEKKK